MLEEEEIKKIKELIDQDFKDFTIGKKLGHSPNTISKIRMEYKDGKLCERSGDEENFGCLEEDLREVLGFMGKRIQKRNMKTRELEKWKKWMDDIREMLRVEVDERIPAERAEAVNERDNQWRGILQQGYVKNETADDLQKSIDMKNTEIEELSIENTRIDNIIKRQQYEINMLKRENNQLNNDNLILINDIQICHYNMNLEKEELSLERQIFNIDQKNLNTYSNNIQSKFIDWFNKNREKELDVEKRERNLVEQGEALDRTRKKIDDELDKLEMIKSEIDLGTEKIKNERIALEKIKQQQKNNEKKPIMLRPIPSSGQPVIQPGFSPENPSITEPTVVECIGEPVIQSRTSQTYCSGVIVNTSGLSGVSQSGVST